MINEERWSCRDDPVTRHLYRAVFGDEWGHDVSTHYGASTDGTMRAGRRASPPLSGAAATAAGSRDGSSTGGAWDDTRTWSVGAPGIAVSADLPLRRLPCAQSRDRSADARCWEDRDASHSPRTGRGAPCLPAGPPRDALARQ